MKQHDLLFVGDPHGDYEGLCALCARESVQVVVFVGDMDLERPLEAELAAILDRTEVYWIHGNHDTDRETWYRHLFGSALADRNLHGRVVEIGGLRVAGLGGVFRAQVWHPGSGVQWPTRKAFLAAHPELRRSGGLPRRHESTLWPEDVEHLAKLRADVLVTHEAPSCHPYGFAELDDLARRMGVRYLVHGHHHVDYQATILGGKVQVIGLGLASIADLSGTRHDPKFEYGRT